MADANSLMGIKFMYFQTTVSIEHPRERFGGQVMTRVILISLKTIFHLSIISIIFFIYFYFILVQY